jgi:hypothetical protein
MGELPACNRLGIPVKVLCSLLVALLFLLAGTAYLENVPPAWWDEGWTLTVARNWAESGHYGRLSLGENSPHGLQAAMPVTMSVALAFKYFGVGLFQARFVIFLYSVAALALLFYLACRFYSRRVAIGALLVLLMMSGNRYMHPLFMARQVLGEVPALFFLLAGYVCLLWAEERSRIFLLGSILFWSLALVTKAQVLPFWALSLSAPFVIAIFMCQWTNAITFALAFFCSALLGYFSQWVISELLIPTPSSVSGLTQAVAFVIDPFRRFITVLTTLQIGLPTLLGLVWAFRNLRSNKVFESHTSAVRFAYFVLAGSWFAWWGLASTGWARYLSPSAFLASIFVSAMLHDWTNGFRIREYVSNAATSLARFHVRWRDLRAAGALFLVGWASVQTVSDLGHALIGKTNKPLFDTVDYLNTRTASSAIIETYESELFFLLDRRYHYPPDQVHVELIRREDLGESRVIDYDPLSADPDYLVVGGWCRYYKCYDSVLTNGAFRLVKTFGSYQVYERIRGKVRPANASQIAGS